MTYVVTLCSFDSKADSNPFWHSALILSKYNRLTKQFEVVQTFGYYAMLAAENQKSWSGALLKKIGVTYDLSGNHGWLQHEEARFMTRGYGLHGDSFELTEEKFNILYNECERRIAEQKAAVAEVAPRYAAELENNSSKKIYRYKEERLSRKIFAEEQSRAQNEGRASRLHPFSLQFSLSKGFSKSHTCKAEALDLLSIVLPPEELMPYQRYAFPRFISTNMEPILLHHDGPLSTHIKASGEQVLYVDAEQPGVRLVWTVPPQKIRPLPESQVHQFAIAEKYLRRVKPLVSQLQQIEWVLLKAEITAGYENYKQDLIDRVRSYYKYFSCFQATVEKNKYQGRLFNRAQDSVSDQIDTIKNFLSELHMAIIDRWTINAAWPSETEFRNLGNLDETQDHSEWNPLEAVVTYFSEEVQKELCDALGRSFIKLPVSNSQ